MNAISLEVAREHLSAWLKAELAVTAGQSYMIGKRQLTRANLTEVRESIKYWESKVNALESQRARKGKNRVFSVVPRDL